MPYHLPPLLFHTKPYSSHYTYPPAGAASVSSPPLAAPTPSAVSAALCALAGRASGVNDIISEALTLRGSYPALAAVAADPAAGALRLTFLNVATEHKISALLPIGKYLSQDLGFVRSMSDDK